MKRKDLIYMGALLASYKKRTTEWSFPQRFFVCGVSGLALCALCCLFFESGGSNFFALFHGYSNDTFMDFFNSICDASVANPYKENGVIYPPLIYLFYRLLYRVFLAFPKNPLDWRNSQQGLLLIAVVSVLVFGALWVLIRKGSPKKLKNILPPLILLGTEPILYAFERANSILIALAFLMLFVEYHDSNDPLKKEIGLLSLAISANIKIYPALWGLLLLREKRWKEAIRCVVYGIALFVCPFFAFGGLSNIGQLITNITSTGTKMNARGYGNRVDVYNFASWLCSDFGLDVPSFPFFAQIAVFALLLLIVFLAKRRWKVYFALSGMMVLLPNFSYIYNLVFIVIPLLAFLSDESEQNGFSSGVYAVLFLCSEAVFPFFGRKLFPFERSEVFPINLCTILENIALCGFLVFLVIDNIIKRKPKFLKEWGGIGSGCCCLRQCWDPLFQDAAVLFELLSNADSVF